MVNLSYRAIMPQDGLLGNIALHSLTHFSANKRRKVVITPDFINVRSTLEQAHFQYESFCLFTVIEIPILFV
jgi:hypothetical protein